MEVEVLGLPVDCCKDQTRVVDDNGKVAHGPSALNIQEADSAALEICVCRETYCMPGLCVSFRSSQSANGGAQGRCLLYWIILSIPVGTELEEL